MKRTWWILGLGALLVGGAAAGWYGQRGEVAPTEVALPTTTVRKGEIVASVSGTGSIQAAERETIRAVWEGTVEEVYFKEGDIVKKGDVLLTYEQEDTAAELQSVRLEREREQLALEELQLEFKQAAEAGEDAQESIRLSIRKQQLTIRELDERIASLQEEDAIGPIVAPIAGTLAAFDVEPGDVLREDADIGEVVNAAAMKVVVEVDELDIPDVAVGQSATVVVDALPDAAFPGTVVDIADEGTDNNGVATFDATVLLTESEGVKIGMSAEATIVTARKSEALYLPIDAVQSAGGRYFVTVPGAGEDAPGRTTETAEAPERTSEAAEPAAETPGRTSGAAERPSGASGAAGERRAAQTGGGVGGTGRVFVEVGIHNADFIEIVSGLEEGDAVVLPTQTGGSAAQAGGFGAQGAGGLGAVVPGAGGFGVPGAGFGGGATRNAGGGGER